MLKNSNLFLNVTKLLYGFRNRPLYVKFLLVFQGKNCYLDKQYCKLDIM